MCSKASLAMNRRAHYDHYTNKHFQFLSNARKQNTDLGKHNESHHKNIICIRDLSSSDKQLFQVIELKRKMKFTIWSHTTLSHSSMSKSLLQFREWYISLPVHGCLHKLWLECLLAAHWTLQVTIHWHSHTISETKNIVTCQSNKFYFGNETGQANFRSVSMKSWVK